ncbi:MAG: Uma2 family endonuclease [Gemmatimonadales bacterium]
MPAAVHRWTREEVLALPDDGKRYELVAGELLVSPSPRRVHQDAVRDLFRLVDSYVRANGIGEVSFSPADLEIRTGEMYQPDLFVVPLVAGCRPREWSDTPTPFLVVEVSSPSTARYDRVVKRPAFQDAGIAEFWIVDLDARLVERWRPADSRPEIVIDRLRWKAAGADTPLEIDLVAFFAELLD